MPETYLIGDPHFDHTNIIRYCNRPFGSVEEMNELILTNWNNTIKPDDLVYFLGDMAFGRDSRKPRWWLSRLNGRIIYFKGSHDKGVRPTSEGLNALEVVDSKVIVIDYLPEPWFDMEILLIHSPYNVSWTWRNWVIHGHVHENRPFIDHGRKRVNVSVEAIGYKPVTLSAVLEAITSDGGVR